MTSLPPLEDRPDQPADHLAPAAAQDTAPLHPWARYWAKTLDIAVFSLLAGIPIAIVGVEGWRGDVLGWLLFVLVFPPVEALLVSRTTGTPGKALFGVTVTAADGGRLDFKTAVQRAYASVLVGLALAIPGLSLATMIAGYWDYTHSGSVYWDRKTGAVYTARPTGKSWIVLCIIGLVVFIFGFLIAASILAA